MVSESWLITKGVLGDYFFWRFGEGTLNTRLETSTGVFMKTDKMNDTKESSTTSSTITTESITLGLTNFDGLDYAY